MSIREASFVGRPSIQPLIVLLFLSLLGLAGCGTRLQPTVVQVEGRAVEVVEAGDGETTVVFESGLGDDWTAWDLVASQVSMGARVFAYSRPGYGQSDVTTEPRDATHIVAELRTILDARRLPPPYLLVGHSFGGAYMELFAKAYPEEVKAVVLVEARHRDFTAACLAARLEGCVPSAEDIRSLPRVQRDEFEAFAHVSEEIEPLGSFGHYPVRVLTATVHWGFGPQLENMWQSMGASLAEEAPNGQLRVFVGAGHYLQNEQSQAVVEAILNLVVQ